MDLTLKLILILYSTPSFRTMPCFLKDSRTPPCSVGGASSPEEAPPTERFDPDFKGRRRTQAAVSPCRSSSSGLGAVSQIRDIRITWTLGTSGSATGSKKHGLLGRGFVVHRLRLLVLSCDGRQLLRSQLVLGHVCEEKTLSGKRLPDTQRSCSVPGLLGKRL
ncbi:hypothetical protein EYF80_062466 [Liparis tanakae]|uniref:Uncharacterized protein n=1 Tax=Liparis tanakae TaxID=230148 RepID=A0A4Z2EET8_9TELE|nr:hypothetical protein EYF80_062466 [Liparis tanakae]